MERSAAAGAVTLGTAGLEGVNTRLAELRAEEGDTLKSEECVRVLGQ